MGSRLLLQQYHFFSVALSVIPSERYLSAVLYAAVLKSLLNSALKRSVSPFPACISSVYSNMPTLPFSVLLSRVKTALSVLIVLFEVTVALISYVPPKRGSAALSSCKDTAKYTVMPIVQQSSTAVISYFFVNNATAKAEMPSNIIPQMRKITNLTKIEAKISPIRYDAPTAANFRLTIIYLLCKLNAQLLAAK